MAGSGGLVGFLKSMMPDLGLALRRFPITIAIAAIFTALHLAGMSDLLGLQGDQSLRLSLALISAFLFVFATGLLGEAKNIGQAAKLGLGAAGIALIAVVFFFQSALSLQPFLVVLTLLLCVGLAPYLGSRHPPVNAAFWQFNHRLWLGAGLAFFGAVLFSGGLSAIVETLELLFDFIFPKSTHEKIWTIGLGFVAPVNWLTLAPEDFSEEIEEGEQQEFTARAIATIVKYILAPLVLVYTAILYAYALKIAAEGALPKGRLGPLVLGYGAVGTLSVLMAYPIRNHGGPLVKALWRHWFWLTLVPVGLLFMAAYQRIAQYGWTEERYLVVAAGVWLLLLAVFFALPGRMRDLRLPPFALAVILLFIAAGPWGAKAVSMTSQVAELNALLNSESRLADGRLRPGVRGALSTREAQLRLRSIVRFLRRSDREDALLALSPDDTVISNDEARKERLRAVLAALGADDPIKPVAAESDFVNFSATGTAHLALSGLENLNGPIYLDLDRAEGSKTIAIGPQSENLSLTYSLKGIVITGRGDTLNFLFSEIIETIRAVASKEGQSAPAVLRLSSVNLSCAMLIERLFKTAAGPKGRLNGRLWLACGKGTGAR